jgi:Flp pilus assembly pilin Flp
MQRIKNFFVNESGAETVEYAIVVGLIAALAAVAYATSLGTTIQSYLNGLL